MYLNISFALKGAETLRFVSLIALLVPVATHGFASLPGKRLEQCRDLGLGIWACLDDHRVRAMAVRTRALEVHERDSLISAFREIKILGPCDNCKKL